MSWRFFLVGAVTLALSLPLRAAADGFAMKDFTQLDPDLSAFQSGAFEARSSEAARLTIICTDCSDQTVIDVQLGRSTDGTEDRYRSGETTIEMMRGICKSRNDSCELEATEVGAAVGWVTSYEAFGGWGSTTVLFLDGDLLTIRSIAAGKDQAVANGSAARDTVAPLIVGGE
ncbi:MAG: hypothetical protein AAF557_21165 [Pseudomonadota bacterium]